MSQHKQKIKAILKAAKTEAHRKQMPGLADDIAIDRIAAYIADEVRKARSQANDNPNLF